jgi:hypothetical protein
MSLVAYCKKASDGLQKSHCNNKCICCIAYIESVKAVWKDRGYYDNQLTN